MVFVPMSVRTGGDPPSARAQDLGRRLKAEVEKFEAQYPGTSRDDLRAAAAIAIGEQAVRVPPRRRLAAGLVAGIIGFGIATTVITTRGAGGGDAAPWPILAVVIAAGVASFAAVIARSRRSGR